MKKRSLKIALIGSLVIFVIGFVMNYFNRQKLPSLDYQDVDLIQLKAPQVGQEIAIIDTTMGTFKVALYRNEAPNAVAHFVDLANKGYYDNKYVHEVITGNYFFAGTTNANGIIVDEGHENREIEMTQFDEEISKNLIPIKGALISLGPDKAKSGTFIAGIGNRINDDKIINELKEAENANEDIVNAFIEHGGDPYLTGKITVFAQTYENMDVFEKIYNAKTDSKKRPENEIKINKITISKYE